MSTKVNVMLDIETLGTRPGSVITSIGAACFDFKKVKLIDVFYTRVDPVSCVENANLAIDASTFLWWLKQNEAARLEMTRPGEAIYNALTDFTEWLKHQGGGFTDMINIWGNGSDFDNALLAEAYRRLRFDIPWKHTNNRCYRTIKNLYPKIKIKNTDIHHHACDDAKAQAFHLMRIAKSEKLDLI